MGDTVEREVRFAVVIYGGVSLAVYINGVVQEMLHMVRATALPESELTPLEQVYRKLGCVTGGSDEATVLQPDSNTLRTRFVVDVLSGTSAGGINAIYLAKALVNNQSLDKLARMWLDVADIKRLLNDGHSAEYPVKPQSPPQSLLNSRWMYLKLLEALDDMDLAAKPGVPLVETLDLFSTTTDIDGVPLPIALADKQVMEFRHRNVFHFRTPRGDGHQDFDTRMNPFLAFAARCTSAFPFAFEPMALCDIFDIVRQRPLHKGQSYCKPDTSEWQRFYKDYIDALDVEESTPFRYRAFGDGGYLDNKPFSYAVETVMKRHADLPVDRKLIYVEPSPEDIGRELKNRKDGGDRPNAIENSLAALVELPRYETIRQDLERVLEWNRNVIRIRRAMDKFKDVTDPPPDFRSSPAHRFYLRLRRSAVTDDVAARVAEALGLDPASARGEVIRGLAGTWRYHEHKSDEHKRAFVDAYDAKYLSRAVQYLRSRLRQDMAGNQDDPVLSGFCDQVVTARKTLSALETTPLPPLTDPNETRETAELRRDHLEFVANPAATKQIAEKLKWTITEDLLGSTRQAYRKRVDYLFGKGWKDQIAAADRELRDFFESPLQKVRESLDAAIKHYGDWDHFEFRDSLLYPLTFGTNLGEADPIDVIRISPADATPIEGVTDQKPASEPALKGHMLGAFGGFLDKRWRLHDMLLGRLHAAERLITAVLSDSDADTVTVREALITRAQQEIANDWSATYKSVIEDEEKTYAAVRPR